MHFLLTSLDRKMARIKFFSRLSLIEPTSTGDVILESEFQEDWIMDQFTMAKPMIELQRTAFDNAMSNVNVVGRE